MQAKSFRIPWAMEPIIALLTSFKDYPPSQKSGSWDIEGIKAQAEAADEELDSD